MQGWEGGVETGASRIHFPSRQERNPGKKCPSRSCLNVSTVKPDENLKNQKD